MIAKTLSRLGIEVWKDIPEYEGYQVSNLGNVRSLFNKSFKNIKGLRQRSKIKKGVKRCFMWFRIFWSVFNKIIKSKTKIIHKLVAYAFLNHKPCGYKLVVNHIDRNKENNNLYNLEIIFQRENANRKHIKSSSKYVGVCWKNNRF